MDKTPSMVTSLEDVLVQEFRACQNLHTLTKDERVALFQNDVTKLTDLVEHKEALLDELGQIEDHRRMIVQNLAQSFGVQSSSPTIAEISAVLNSEPSDRISRLREGILALTGDIRDLTDGNQALAISALERVDAVQAFLLELYSPTLLYQPPGTAPQAEQDMTLDIDQHR